MRVNYIEDLKPIADRLKNIDSDLVLFLNRNYRKDTFRVVFSSENQDYKESFERVSKQLGMAMGGIAIMNYSYLCTKEYPTASLEIYSENSNFPETSEDIDKVVNFIKEVINDHNKTRK